MEPEPQPPRLSSVTKRPFDSTRPLPVAMILTLMCLARRIDSGSQVEGYAPAESFVGVARLVMVEAGPRMSK